MFWELQAWCASLSGSPHRSKHTDYGLYQAQQFYLRVHPLEFLTIPAHKPRPSVPNRTLHPLIRLHTRIGIKRSMRGNELAYQTVHVENFCMRRHRQRHVCSAVQSMVWFGSPASQFFRMSLSYPLSYRSLMRQSHL